MSEIKSSLADPGPLGLAGFGLTTVVLSLLNAHIVSSHVMGVVLPLALAYGGFAQLLAGMWEFRKGNTFGATAFTSYGAFWISFYFLINNAASLGTSAGQGVGVYLLMWGVFTLYMMFGSLYTNRSLFLVFLFLMLTFFLLAIANFSGSTTVLGGIIGLVTGILALYTSAAGVINTSANKTVLPLGKSPLQPRN